MKITKMFATALALLLMMTIPAMTLAETSAPKVYTNEEMLTLAIQSEYLAKAQYDAFQKAFGLQRPLTNLAGAEDVHIATIKALLESFGYAVPEDASAAKVSVPATAEDAYTLGVETETANIALYDGFLAQENLPDSLKTVFTALKNASTNHLNALVRTESRLGNQGNGMYGRRQNNMGGMGNMGRRGSMGCQGGAQQNRNANGTCNGSCLNQP